MRKPKVGIQIDSAFELINGSIVSVPEKEGQTQIPSYFRRDWIDLLGSARLSDGLVGTAQRREVFAVPLMSRCVVLVKLDCPPEFVFGTGPVPIVTKFDHRQRCVGFGQGIVQPQRLHYRTPRSWHSLFECKVHRG